MEASSNSNSTRVNTNSLYITDFGDFSQEQPQGYTVIARSCGSSSLAYLFVPLEMRG